MKFFRDQIIKTCLTVFNIRGQIVAKLVDGNLGMGAYKITFNAENLTSGVYYYHIQSNDFNQVRKMTLMQ